MGDLWIDFDNKSPYTDYRRELNLDDATARVSYKQGDVNFKREIFISHPDQSMVMRISADKIRSAHLAMPVILAAYLYGKRATDHGRGTFGR